MPTLHRYSISNRKRLIDSEPIKRGEPPLVWSKDRHEWIEMDLASGEHVDSVPVTDEEAQNICETDEIPERISQYTRLGISDSEEEIRKG
jgi:hypothetical protein